MALELARIARIRVMALLKCLIGVSSVVVDLLYIGWVTSSPKLRLTLSFSVTVFDFLQLTRMLCGCKLCVPVGCSIPTDNSVFIARMTKLANFCLTRTSCAGFFFSSTFLSVSGPNISCI
jgi:hypothetical protein